MVIPDKCIRYNESTKSYWVYLQYGYQNYKWIGSKATLEEAQNFYQESFTKVFSQ